MPTIDPGAARLAIVIVSYRSAGMIAAALPALVAEMDTVAEARTLIVDNASPDGDAERMAAHLARLGDPRVSLIRSPRNGGFAAGNNVAFAALRAEGWAPDAVLLLNPDAELRPGALAAMLAVLAVQPRAGVVGALVEDDDGVLDSPALHFPSAMGELARQSALTALLRIWPNGYPPHDAPARVDWVQGAAALIRGATLAELGDMDEGYFLYYEEVDYMLAATRAGWEVWTAPSARARHVGGATTGIVSGKPTVGPMPAYWFESWSRYFTKNHGAPYARFAAAMRLTGMAIGALKRALQGKRRPQPPGFWAEFARVCLLGRAARRGA